MFLFLDYVLRCVFSCVIVVILSLLSGEIVSIGPLTLRNYSLNWTTLTFVASIELNKYKINHLEWNLKTREIRSDDIKNLQLNYTCFRSLLSLSEMLFNYNSTYGNVEIKALTSNTGLIKIIGLDKFRGILEFKYIINKDKVHIIKTNVHEFTILPLSYKIKSSDYFDIVYNLKSKTLTLDARDLFFRVKFDTEYIHGDVTSKLNDLKGKMSFTVKDSLFLRFDLETVDLINVLKEVIDISMRPEISDAQNSIGIVLDGKANECRLISNKVNNATFHLSVQNGKIHNFRGAATTTKGSKIMLRSENAGPIILRCNSAQEAWGLISEIPLIRNGSISGMIDLNHPKKIWKVSLKNIEVPPLSNIQIKHAISPIRWVRTMFSNPRQIPVLNIKGNIVDEYINIHKLEGNNQYYKLLFNGQLDLLRERINFKGKIFDSNLMSTFIEDIIQIEVFGPLANPKMSFKIGPGSVLTALMQLILN